VNTPKLLKIARELLSDQGFGAMPGTPRRFLRPSAAKAEAAFPIFTLSVR
jgi:hypothetical protein